MREAPSFLKWKSFSCIQLYSPWNSPGKNTGVGSLSLLQGIFQTQGLNPGLPHCRPDSLPAEPQGKPPSITGGFYWVNSWFPVLLLLNVSTFSVKEANSNLSAVEIDNVWLLDARACTKYWWRRKMNLKWRYNFLINWYFSKRNFKWSSFCILKMLTCKTLYWTLLGN